MNKTRQFVLGSIVTPLVVAIIGAGGVLGVGIVQANDNDISCSQTRSEVLEQAKENPKVLDVPFPKDSDEEEQCHINEFMGELGPGDG